MLPNLCFVLAAFVGLVVYVAVLKFLYDQSEVQVLSTGQFAIAIGYGIVLSLWSGAEAGFMAARMQPQYDSIAEDEQDLVTDEKKEGEADTKAALPPTATILGVKHAHLPALRAMGEFSLIMLFLYLCDRTLLVAKGPKYVNPTAFWSVNAAILLVALFTIRGAHAAPSEPMDAHVKPLQRDQTEEWKGWMQVRRSRSVVRGGGHLAGDTHRTRARARLLALSCTP